MYEGDALALAKDGMPGFNPELFAAMADMIYKKGGFDINQLKSKEARSVMAETARIINSCVSSSLPEDCPDALRYALENNAFIFSGFKTFHSMREIGLSMVTDRGTVKQYEDFKKDVQRINAHYNTNYLHAEYYHAVGSAQMAARWSEYAKDGARYDLQYRTAGDSHVREEHRLLDGITLPVDDPFWDKYFPPNGWGCRCEAVQVRKGKYPLSDSADSMRKGDNITAGVKQQIFRFNPGKTMKLFPPKHPYYKVPHEVKEKINEVASEEQSKMQAKELVKWYKENLPTTKVGKFNAKRFNVSMPNGEHVYVTRNFYNECISKYASDKLYIARLIYARMAHLILPNSKRISVEKGIDHPDATFDVYQFDEDSKYTIELKVKRNNDGLFLHYLRLYEKQK